VGKPGQSSSSRGEATVARHIRRKVTVEIHTGKDSIIKSGDHQEHWAEFQDDGKDLFMKLKTGPCAGQWARWEDTEDGQAIFRNGTGHEIRVFWPNMNDVSLACWKAQNKRQEG